jgi:hypothetical protein
MGKAMRMVKRMKTMPERNEEAMLLDMIMADSRL